MTNTNVNGGEQLQPQQTQQAGQPAQAQSAPQPSKPNEKPGWWAIHMPTWLGGASREELAQQGHEYIPNAWQRGMPTWLGGWSNEELAPFKFQRDSSIPVSWYGRWMPTWLGGTSKEDIKAADDYQQRYAALYNQPNLYQRLMPTWLGGLSNEEIQQRKQQYELAKQQVELDKNVLGTVSSSELLQAGVTPQQLQQIQRHVKAKVEAWKLGGRQGSVPQVNLVEVFNGDRKLASQVYKAYQQQSALDAARAGGANGALRGASENAQTPTEGQRPVGPRNGGDSR